MPIDEEQFARLVRRVEKLEERFGDVLAALAERWSSLSEGEKADAAKVAQAAAGIRPKKRNGGGKPT